MIFLEPAFLMGANSGPRSHSWLRGGSRRQQNRTVKGDCATTESSLGLASLLI
jgi:hypothetical protein